MLALITISTDQSSTDNVLVLTSDHCKLCSMSIDDVLLVSFDHVSYVLLTDVHLADKIMKTGCDRAGSDA